jgi:hypothetical protein
MLERFLVPCIVTLLAACGSARPADEPRLDGGLPLDGGSRLDGGPPARDGGLADGSLLDGGVPDGGSPALDGGRSDGGPCPLPVRDGGPINPGWIGGRCAQDSDCAYHGGICLRAEEGFPEGLCTLACTSLCPDRTGPDDTVTFCIAGTGRLSGGGMCVSRCDFEREPLGCRPGYHCLPGARTSDASFLRNVCLVGPVTCYQEASDRCLNYRAVPNPLDVPAECPNRLCDVRDAMVLGNPIDGIVYRTGAGAIADLFVSCPLAIALHRLAPILRDMGVVEVTHYGTYNCRQIAGTNCTLSQHALGLAIDFGAFKLADGGVVSVSQDWEPVVSIPIEPRADNPCRFDYTPTTEKGRWLYELVYRMCDARIWSIILTPNYNAAHDDHFHLDLTAGYDSTYLGFTPERTVLRSYCGRE